MADIAGGLIPEASALISGLTDHRHVGGLVITEELSSGLTDHRAAGSALGLGGGGVSVTTYYKLRVRDSGLGPPAVYRVWTSTDPASSPPAPDPVGSWVERIVLSSWSV